VDIGVALGVFIERPALALAPCAVLAVGYLFTRNIVILISALSWLAYFPYERAMKLRILCSGDCDIRVDLLLLYPILICLSLYSMVAIVRHLVRKVEPQ
jgi:hypothetical protein